jgi:allantoinase
LAFLPGLIVRSQRVVTSDGVRPAAVHIRGEKIVGVLDFSDVPAGCPLDDAGQAAVIPGLVDTHVHLNDSEKTVGETLEATTRAAAVGGITALVGLSPSLATTAEGVATIRVAADGHCTSTSGSGAVPCQATSASSCRCSDEEGVPR